MNKEEVMKLAREAGPLISTPFDIWCERFADLVAAHKTEVAVAEAYRCGHEAGMVEEREECAKVCDGWLHADGDQCAEAIRNRGNT